LIRSGDNGREIASESNDEVLYITPDLIPGSYLVSAAKSGFKTEIFGPVVLHINQTARVDFTLDIGVASESVRVEATAVQLLSTEGAEISQVVSQTGYGNSTERTSLAAADYGKRRHKPRSARGERLSKSGKCERPTDQSKPIPGRRDFDNVVAQGRGNSFNMPLEAVREFSVQSGSYSAEYGNVAGGVVNLMSKSGTNEWHGSIFEFLRNDAMDAQTSSPTRPGSQKIRFDTTNSDWRWEVRSAVTAPFSSPTTKARFPAMRHLGSTVPSDEQRRGDFSNLRDSQGSLIPIYDPFGASLARTPFSGNVIALDLMDPAAVKLTALLPEPNQFDVNGHALPFNNYAVTRTALADTHAFDIRGDNQVSSQSTLFGRHSLQNTETISPSLFGLPLGGSFRLAGTTEHAIRIQGSDTHIRSNPH
jgi:hypothetical protein